jgi:hypothetical protein
LSHPILTKEELIEHGRARYASKRKAGIPEFRKDGSKTSASNDIEAAAAEYFAALHYDRPFNDEVTTTGDGGADFFLNEKSVEVIWLGQTQYKKPRKNGHLIVNPHEPHRWADLYVIVRGSIETGFDIAGWTTHEELLAKPRKDFGYGERFAMNITDLRQTDMEEETK